MAYSYDRRAMFEDYPVPPGWEMLRWGYQRKDGKAKVEPHGQHGRWVVSVLTAKGKWRRVKQNMKDEQKVMALADSEIARGT